MEKLKIEYIPVSEIVEYQNNPKKHPQSQIDKIKSSLKENGFVNPILLNKENVIIAGHGRLRASKELNYKEVPVIWLEHLSEAQQKAYRIADNKLTESEWDDELLNIEFEGLKEMGTNLELTGFSKEEITLINVEKEIEVGIRSNVIMINPSEAPKLKERFGIHFKRIEDYQKVKEYLEEKGAEKLLDLIK